MAFIEDPVVSENRRLQAVLASIAEGVNIVDAQGALVLANDGFMRMYGFPPELSLPGTPLRTFIQHRLAGSDPAEGDLEAVIMARSEEILGTAPASFEEQLPDGRAVLVRRQRVEGGWIVSTYNDVTALHERERQTTLLATAVMRTGDSVEIAGADYRLLYVNPAFTVLTGWSAEEAIGRTPAELLRSSFHDEAFFAAIDATLRCGCSWTGRVVSRHKDGRLVHQDATISPILDRKGKLTHFVAVRRDMTGPIAIEEALRASEARFHAAARNIPAGLAIFDVEDRFVFFNERFPADAPEPLRAELRLGLRYEEWIRRGLARGPIFHADMGADYAERRLAQRVAGDIDRVLRLVDGRWLRLRESRMPDGGRVVLTTDITLARESEHALRKSEERFRSIVDDQVEFISRLDVDLKLTFVNEAYARQLGQPRELIIGSSLLELMDRSQREQFLRQLASLTPKRPTIGYEMTGSRADGTPSIEAWVDRALFDTAGRLVEYQSVGRDVTEERLAERRLRESEGRFRAIAEGVPLPIVITDVTAPRILFANAAARRTFDLPEPGGVLAPEQVWVEPWQRQAIAEQLLTEGAVDHVEVQLRRADGTLFPAILSAQMIRYGDQPAVLGAVTDLTERRRVEEALRASEARLAAFMQFAPVGMHVKDREGHYVLANPEMSNVFGRPADSVIGLRPADLFPVEEAAMIDRHHREVVESARPTMFEEHQPSLERYRWASMIRFPIKDARGEVIAVGAFALDITPQKQAEAQLRASEQRFRILADIHPIPLVIIRLGDRWPIFVNRAYVEQFDLTLEKVRSGFDRSRLFVDPADRERLYAALAQGESIEAMEMAMRDGAGRPFPAVVASRPLLYDGEQCFVMSIQDLSELKLAEAEIARQREVLHQTEKLTALGSLLAGVAHELNNPLSVVVGYSSLLGELATDPESRARAQKIHVAAERCARIVKTFLAMARQKPPVWGIVDVAAVIQGALDLAAYQLRTADIAVTCEIEPGLPGIWGDADQLHQVVTNLVVNAQQALLQLETPRRLDLRAGSPRPGEIVVEVADNGPGMTEQVRQRVFEPFFTTKPQGVGTGIGLSVSHAIVTAHEGRIEVESAPGRGCTFLVTLPVRAPVVEVRGATPQPLRAGDKAGAKRVLVVDDETEIADLVADALRRDGLEVDTAPSGRAALARLAEATYHAVVTDLRMPDLDGPALIRALREQHPELAQRVLIVTGDLLGAELDEMLRAATLPVQEKPLDLAALRRKVAELLA